MASSDIEALRDSAATIVKLLKEQFKATNAPLQHLIQLPNYFESVNTELATNFKNLFVGTMEAAVLNNQALITVLESKSEFVGEHISKKNGNARKIIETILEDYKGYFGEIATEHDLFLSKLDEHAYALIDRNYVEQVQKRFSNDSYPAGLLLGQYLMLSSFLTTEYDQRLRNEIRALVDRYLTSVSSVARSGGSDGEREMSEGCYELPVWFVETEDLRTGERTLVFFNEKGLVEELPYEPDTNAAIVDASRGKIGPANETSGEDLLSNFESILGGPAMEQLRSDCQTIRV
jgi:hypothetical protein